MRRDSAAVRTGESDAEPELVRTIEAGETATLGPGEWIVDQPSDVHEAANEGAEAIVIYLATLLEAGATPATPVGEGG